MKKQKEIKNFWDKESKEYDSHMKVTKHYLAQENLFRMLEKEFSSPILELACGSGYMLKILSNKKTKVFGNDFSKKMVNMAKKENPNTKITNNDATKLDDYENNSLGTVLCSNLFFYVPDKENAVKVWSRVLKKEGKLIFFEEYPFLISKGNEEFTKDKNYLLDLVKPLSPNEIINLVEKLGFKITKKAKVPIDNKHELYGLVFEKK